MQTAGTDIESIIPPEVELFEVFSIQVANIVQARTDMPLEDTIALQVALLCLAQKVYPDRVDYVDKVLGTTAQILEQLNMNKYVCLFVWRFVFTEKMFVFFYIFFLAFLTCYP